MLAGLRVSYGIKDLSGVDAIGKNLSDTMNYKDYQPTNLASGGLLIKLAYSFGN